VKKTHLLAVSAAGLLSMIFLTPIFSQNTPARSQAAPATGSRVALVDITKIFKNHLRFKALMNQMKNDVDQAETRVRNQNSEIRALAEKLQSLKPGSQDYKDLEEKITTQRAMLQIDMNKQRKDFMQNEARIYHDVYKEVEEELNYLCQQNAIDVVLKFNGDQVDVNNPDMVFAWMNRPVVWYNRQLDITQYVVDALNRRAPAAPVNNNALGRQPAAPNSIPFK
jgi:Skp family chaperone for outer membrane proteins